MITLDYEDPGNASQIENHLKIPSLVVQYSQDLIIDVV